MNELNRRGNEKDWKIWIEVSVWRERIEVREAVFIQFLKLKRRQQEDLEVGMSCSYVRKALPTGSSFWYYIIVWGHITGITFVYDFIIIIGYIENKPNGHCKPYEWSLFRYSLKQLARICSYNISYRIFISIIIKLRIVCNDALRRIACWTSSIVSIFSSFVATTAIHRGLKILTCPKQA